MSPLIRPASFFPYAPEPRTPLTANDSFESSGCVRSAYTLDAACANSNADKTKCKANQSNSTTATSSAPPLTLCPMAVFRPIYCSSALPAVKPKAAFRSTRCNTLRARRRHSNIRTAGDAIGSTLADENDVGARNTATFQVDAFDVDIHLETGVASFEQTRAAVEPRSSLYPGSSATFRMRRPSRSH